MTRLLAMICIALSVLAATPAHAQFGFGGDLPVDVRAETATYQGGLTVLETEVRVAQDDTAVYADRMEIYRDETQGDNSAAGSLKLGEITRIEAEGAFRFESPENTITGARGIYYADRKVFVVTGNVVLTQPSGSSVRGDRLVYNITSKSAKFGTPCETDPGAQEGCDRVRIRIE